MAEPVEVQELTMLVQNAGDDDPRSGLKATAQALRKLERLQGVQVRRARLQGRTWAEIAEALGVSKQAVHKKYGGRRLFRSEE